MMTRERLNQIGPVIDTLMSDAGIRSAFYDIAAEETRLCEGQLVNAARRQDSCESNMLVGQIDGITNFMGALAKVALDYRKRKTSES